MSACAEELVLDDVDVGIPTAHPIANVYFQAAVELGLGIDIYNERDGIGAVFDEGGQQLLVFGRWIGINDLTASTRCAIKTYSARELSAAGLPVPQTAPVEIARRRSVEVFSREVIEAARNRYPICLKPVSGSHGIRVVPDIRDEEELLRVLFDDMKISLSTVMIESHCEGRHYRVITAYGRIVGCAERTPPQVTGDGKATLNELVERYNQPRTIMNIEPVKLGSRQIYTINRRHGLQPADVVPDGTTVTLDDRCNLKVGGNIHYVDADSLHPNAADICLRSAAQFDLDYAGIDLIGDDIASDGHWMVNEVNSQPAAHVPVPTLSRWQRLIWPRRVLALHFGLEHDGSKREDSQRDNLEQDIG